ncbi:MAG: bifunctional 2-polyprenyl-6-hydroxyphenol methylase/3-demethylubiquinol 3-O-methyltransferase UbiG [Sphingomonadaceae bacterium]
MAARPAARPAAAAGPAGTADPANVALFAGLAKDWWDPNGPNRLLHRINPARMAYIRDRAVAHFGRDPRARQPLLGLRAIDVGCGGGLVAEPLARMGAETSGLDAAGDSIAVARAHAAARGLAIDYHHGEITALAEASPAAFDLATCLEVVEHVADRAAFLAALRRLLKPGGLLVFSTPNRTLASLLLVKVGAEYVTGDIPKGGHDWRRFLTPEEMTRALAAAGLRVDEIAGFSWSPATGFRVGGSPQVTYIGHATAI